MDLLKLRLYPKCLQHAYVQWWRGSSGDMTWPWRAASRNKAFVVATKSASLDSPPPFTEANIRIMVFDQRLSLRPRHALIHLSLHALIPLLLHIACLKFARAEMPSSSTPHRRWREQERHDGHHHHLSASHRNFNRSSPTVSATRRGKLSAVSLESEHGRPAADRVRRGECSTHSLADKTNSSSTCGMLTHASAYRGRPQWHLHLPHHAVKSAHR
jgi:hypothetical protein